MDVQNDARVAITRQNIIRRQTMMSINCRVLLCYSLVLFAVALIWITIINTQPLPIIIFSCTFTGIVILSCCCYSLRQRTLRRQLQLLNASDPNAAEMIAQLRRNLYNMNNGLGTGDFGKIPVISFSEEQYLLDNDPSNLVLTPRRKSISAPSHEGLPADQSGLYCNVSRECSVCLCQYENLDAVAVLPCFHFFHQQCIGEWLSRNDACPLCKQSVSVMLSKPIQSNGYATPPTQMNSPGRSDSRSASDRNSPLAPSEQHVAISIEALHAGEDEAEARSSLEIQRLVSLDTSYTARVGTADIESGRTNLGDDGGDAVGDSAADTSPPVFGLGFGIGRDGRFTYINLFEEKDAEEDEDEVERGGSDQIRHTHPSPLSLSQSRSRSMTEGSDSLSTAPATAAAPYHRLRSSEVVYSRDSSIEEV